MIKVGISENVEIVKAGINDRGTLVISIAVTEGEKSLEDLMNNTDTGDTGSQSQDLYVWPFKLDEYNKTGKDLLTTANNIKKSLTHILEGYMISEEIKWNLLNGITVDDVDTDMIKGSNIEKLYSNLIEQFIEMVKPFLGKGNLFRVKLVRQSEKKHFSDLPKVRDFTNLIRDPFWESMDILDSASKIHYTPYELGYRKTKGDKIGTLPYSGVDLSNGEPVVEESVVSEEEASAADEMMGGSDSIDSIN